jgi:hypothetical protein
MSVQHPVERDPSPAPGDRSVESALRHRLAVTTDWAHRHALDAAILRRQLSVATGDPYGGAAGALRAELVDAQLQLAAVRAELERLRALPELKAGQRLRRRRSTPPATPVSTPPAVADDDDRFEVAATGSGAEAGVTAVIRVRNRRSGLPGLLDWLVTHGVERVEIVDDGSADPATVQLLDESPYQLHRLEAPVGPNAPFVVGLVAGLVSAGPVLVVDADAAVDDAAPADLLAQMLDQLAAEPGLDAVRLCAEAGGVPAPEWLLVREGIDHVPTSIGALVVPGTLRSAADGVDPDDPAERFARLHDDPDGTDPAVR